MSILQLLAPESIPTGLLNFNRALLGESRTLDAVINALRHGHARQLNISFIRHNGTIQLIIRDDGKGFNPQTVISGGGHGLSIMRHRAEIIHACIDIHRAEEHGGTIVTCALPAPTDNITTA